MSHRLRERYKRIAEELLQEEDSAEPVQRHKGGVVQGSLGNV